MQTEKNEDEMWCQEPAAEASRLHRWHRYRSDVFRYVGRLVGLIVKRRGLGVAHRERVDAEEERHAIVVRTTSDTYGAASLRGAFILRQEDVRGIRTGRIWSCDGLRMHGWEDAT